MNSRELVRNTLEMNQPPRIPQQLFKPLYREYAEMAHRRGKYIFMHSDGNIFKILDDLIEVGIDAVNAQIFCMGIDALGQRYRGRITFWGEIDRQYLLAYGTPEQVQEAVESVYSSLYSDGGVIAQCEFGPGAKPENIDRVFSSWEGIDERRRKERV